MPHDWRADEHGRAGSTLPKRQEQNPFSSDVSHSRKFTRQVEAVLSAMTIKPVESKVESWRSEEA
jgi:hypothetical protein